MESPTPYPELNELLRELVRRLLETLGETFVGAYLQGSFAVGDCDENSDVDFIVAVRDELSEVQVADLQLLHGTVFDLECPWAQHLEGSYFPLEVLRRTARAGEALWYLDNGSRSLVRSDHCNTRLVRWVVREMAVTLAGPPPATLVEPIPVDDLRREIRDVITGWGGEILAEPDRWRNRFYQGFIALNYARMLHDLMRGRAGSKRQGAEWASRNLDPRWAGLLDRAWATRADPARSVREPPDPGDYAQTLEFVRYVMEECRRYPTARVDVP